MQHYCFNCVKKKKEEDMIQMSLLSLNHGANNKQINDRLNFFLLKFSTMIC